ncbi:short-chain dehydrogenase/reductase SDR [Tolypothrix sp. NIES-4075]|uniref:SDR family oxidoreductase n=1 Tax=Tolypothrix sp. NIES-4075 TaxID=2005459 RepID=UPI000B5C9E2A|nr:SDR family oxidoreductase [Tolypothrix sp. NIES-4075]GAX41609.1 short-chain dehydrogenase/reductase SDR [Tolypothrix sp. NIES-4075]
MTSQSAENKVALITGANKGIGLEIARQLGVQGITVLIGARDEKRGQEAAEKLHSEHNIDAHAVQLDVTDHSTIEAAAKHIESEFGKLDILVNNAGIAVDSVPPSQLDIEVLRRTYDTNFFGVFAVIKAMLPLLHKSDAGRIVNMSSGLGSLTQNSDPNYEYAQMKILAYNSSKTALNAMTIQFAHELKDTPIKVNSADPGYVATDINANRGPRTVEQGATAPVRLATLPDDGPTGGFFDENGVVPW